MVPSLAANLISPANSLIASLGGELDGRRQSFHTAGADLCTTICVEFGSSGFGAPGRAGRCSPPRHVGGQHRDEGRRRRAAPYGTLTTFWVDCCGCGTCPRLSQKVPTPGQGWGWRRGFGLAQSRPPTLARVPDDTSGLFT